MSSPPPILAESFATLRRAAKADAGAANPRLESALHMLILALVAALAHAAILPGGTAWHPAAANRHGVTRHGIPGLRIARHRGPIPARCRRIGRMPCWFAANYGAATISGRLRAIPTLPARAPPTLLLSLPLR